MAQIIEHCYKAREASVCGVCYVGSEQVCGSVQVAEHHMPWPPRRGFTIASAPANGDADPMALGPQRHLLGKPGLADAGPLIVTTYPWPRLATSRSCIN
jgi:hypothetical protein